MVSIEQLFQARRWGLPYGRLVGMLLIRTQGEGGRGPQYL